MLVPLESLSALFVTESSKSMSICNRFNGRLVHRNINREFWICIRIWRPRAE